MNYQPTKGKIITSIIATAAWYGFWALMSAATVCNGSFELTYEMAHPCTSDYYKYSTLQFSCAHTCMSLGELIWQYIYVFIIPLIVVYVVYSLFQKKKKDLVA